MTAATRHPTDDLAMAYRAGSRQAGQALIKALGPLCRSAALAVSRATGADLDDMIQACRIGALRAVPTYDAARGASFSTYAFLQMRHEMRVVVAESRTVHVPVWADTAAIKARRSGDHVPKIAECVSFDDAERIPLRHFVSDEPSPEDAMSAAEEYALLLGELTDKERSVIERRIGDETLKEIGDDMALSRERIRQIEAMAMAKMRKRLGIADTKEQKAA